MFFTGSTSCVHNARHSMVGFTSRQILTEELCELLARPYGAAFTGWKLIRCVTQSEVSGSSIRVIYCIDFLNCACLEHYFRSATYDAVFKYDLLLPFTIY